ncbi:hypothetical protein A3C05_04865 [Candidatus Giovannonibacteria bacterium RIFCSPHIGHO2_02_FULL_45_40]|uniref:Uncharacterized protein n=1 Tax=Candidatus Giovannonibacteria bacterium RIFCSPHIGHO2_02_FULL_45_40 TaxID=1798337 RepID=A0A1F5WBS3_9BACT|nr:MAG: hypothetical protein A3C05_04865 [Candidatus Giovannonibacteria bacterium RIFCSPHIGHO2_02_FULL_45_40]
MEEGNKMTIETEWFSITAKTEKGLQGKLDRKLKRLEKKLGKKCISLSICDRYSMFSDTKSRDHCSLESNRVGDTVKYIARFEFE